MPTKTTAGKEAGDRRLFGDEETALALANALEYSDEVDRFTHGFHTYPAGLHPDCARGILDLFPGERVLDPFCGGGTVLVETRAQGRTAIGRDVSGVAALVSAMRTATPDDATLTRFRSTARKLTEAARAAPVVRTGERYEKVKDWYAPVALNELESLWTGIQAVEDPHLKTQLLGIFSSILIKVSWRKSDTSAQRVKHRRPAGTTAILFHKKARELARRQVELRAAVDPSAPVADIQLADARELALNEKVDLVLTSPPYPAVYDYLPMQHLRWAWLDSSEGMGWTREIGARRYWRKGSKKAKTDWVKDTRKWTQRMGQCLNKGGKLVVVIGDGLTPSGSIDCVAATKTAAIDAGFKTMAHASLARPDHARDSVRWEHIFVFRRIS